MVKRGNFITKNMENMHLNVKNDNWVDTMFHKYDHRQVQHELVHLRKEAVLKQTRDHMEYNLVKWEIARRLKEDHLIEAKNVIIRKCRVISLVAKILVAKAINVANCHLEKRRAARTLKNK